MGRGCGGGEEGRAGPTSRAGEGEGTIHGDNTNTCPGVCAWPGFAAENAWAGELTRVRYRARGCAAMGGAGARVTGHGAERDRERLVLLRTEDATAVLHPLNQGDNAPPLMDTGQEEQEGMNMSCG